MKRMQLWGRGGVLLRFIVVSTVLCSIATSVRAEGPTPPPHRDISAVLLLVENYNKTRDKQKRKKYLDLLKNRKQNWDAMFLAASKLRLGRFNVLMPMLAEPGKAVVPKIAELLTWNPGASFNAAVHVTKRLGDDAVPLLMEQYKASASVWVRRYAVVGVKYILEKNAGKKADAAGRLQWTLKVLNDKDDGVGRYALDILGSLFTEDNAGQIEPVLKAKLKDAEPITRMRAIRVLMEVRPKADYVVEHVMTSALKSKNRSERSMNIRLCGTLPVSADMLNVLYECAFDKEARVRDYAAKALLPLRSKTAPLADKMLKKLQDGNADSLLAIMAVLRNDKKNSDAIEKSLVKLLSNKNSRVRSLCIHYLKDLPSLKDDTVRKFAELLSDPDSSVRRIAIRAIHMFREKPFVKDAISKRVGAETDRTAKKFLKIFMAEYEQGV